MQEGTSSLMQMAKVSVAVEALQRAHLPFVVVLNDPTYGGVSASYAMQADVKIALSDSRIGFAGPQVILNTMCAADQSKYDDTCPADFQSASYVWEHGQLDCILEAGEGQQQRLVETVAGVVYLLAPADSNCRLAIADTSEEASPISCDDDDEADRAQALNYTNSRRIDRPQVQELFYMDYCIITNNYHELVASDPRYHWQAVQSFRRAFRRRPDGSGLLHPRWRLRASRGGPRAGLCCRRHLQGTHPANDAGS